MTIIHGNNNMRGQSGYGHMTLVRETEKECLQGSLGLLSDTGWQSWQPFGECKKWPHSFPRVTFIEEKDMIE